MMQARDIFLMRLITIALLRVSSLVYAPIGLWAATSWFLEGLRDGDIFDLSYYFPRALLSFTSLGLLVFAWPLGALATRLIVPAPDWTRCPRCSYAWNTKAACCSECGLPTGVPRPSDED